MTIKKRLARSNFSMLVIPILVAAALGLLAAGGSTFAAAGGHRDLV